VAFGSAARRSIRLERVPGGAVLLTALLLGCGARALVDASPDEEEFGTAAAGGAAGRGGGGGDGGRAGGGASPVNPVGPRGAIDLDGITLPDCEPGFSMGTAGSRDCTYLFRGDCYEDQLMACACACQGLADSRCIIGGFLNPNDPQRVSCVQR
jgi:hypothetical protein